MRKLLVLGIVLAACGGKKASNEPPPAKPGHGAPIAFVEKGLKAGDNRGGSVTVKAYNFADKPVAQYMLLFRYFDAAGAPLRVKVGTPFEKDFDFMSLSGNKYKCPAKSWCGPFEIDNLDVPAKAVKAEVIAKSVTALKDGTSFEAAPLFDSPGMDWPGEKPAEAKPPEAEAKPSGSGEAGPGSAGSAATP